MADSHYSYHIEKLHEAALTSPYNRKCIAQDLRQLLAKLEKSQPSDPLSPLETMPLHVLQMIVGEATVESVARLLRTSSTMHERLLRTTKWMSPLVKEESRFFPNTVKHYYYRATETEYGNLDFHHEELGDLSLDHLLRTPFRFEILEIVALDEYREDAEYGILREAEVADDFTVKYSYSYRPRDDFSLFKKDIKILRKVAKDFAVYFDDYYPGDEECREFLRIFKPKIVTFPRNSIDYMVTSDMLPELTSVNFLDLNNNVEKFSMELLMQIPRVEGKFLKLWYLQEFLIHFATKKTDIKIVKHVYYMEEGTTCQLIDELFEQVGGQLKVDEHLPSWACQNGQKRLLAVMKEHVIVITMADI